MDNSKKIRDNPIFIANVYMMKQKQETSEQNILYIWDNNLSM